VKLHATTNTFRWTGISVCPEWRLFSAGVAALVIAFALGMQAIPAVSVSETIEPESFESRASLESQNLDSANTFDERFASVVDWPSGRQNVEREGRANDIALLPRDLGGHSAGAQFPMPSAQSASRFTQTGIASVYSVRGGLRTASGVHLNPGALTAAHRALPFGTTARVKNLGIKRAHGSCSRWRFSQAPGIPVQLICECPRVTISENCYNHKRARVRLPALIRDGRLQNGPAISAGGAALRSRRSRLCCKGTSLDTDNLKLAHPQPR